jgi:dihydrofolate synthase/folylpolyglutamate synthase
MSYAAAIERLNALGRELHAAPGEPRRKFDLSHMRVLMRALGDPQQRFVAILVAGTNGKGSTASSLASILRQAGYHTGLYTSPHLVRVNERIQVDGAAIGDEEFGALFFQVEETAAALVNAGDLPQMPSFFETVTAIGFLCFAGRGVHTAVVEVGLGGRLDATNIVEPAISVITDISLDHMEWLGTTITEIAREKAGILRPGGVMVTLPQHPEANQALGEVATSLGVRGVNAADYIPSRLVDEREGSETLFESGRNRYPLTVMGEEIAIDSPLAGVHQRRNLALAIAAAIEIRNNHGYVINAAAIAAGIRNTVWPGRLEEFASQGARPAVVLDVGHNPAGAWAVRAAVSHRSQPMTLVFGCLSDKPLTEMAQILFPRFDRVIVTEVDSPRSSSLSDLLAAAEATGSEAHAAASVEAALERAYETTPPGGLVVVTGSVFLVGKARALLTENALVPTETLQA